MVVVGGLTGSVIGAEGCLARGHVVVVVVVGGIREQISMIVALFLLLVTGALLLFQSTQKA